MSIVLIDTNDLAEAEAVLSANYTKQHLSPQPGAPTHTKLERSQLGPLIVDDLSYSYDLKTVAHPLDRIALCRVRSGVLEQEFPDGHTEATQSDQVTAIGAQADLDIDFTMKQPHFDSFHIDRALFDRVAAGPVERGESVPVCLTSEAPLSPAANAHVVSVIDHIIDHVLISPDVADSPLVAGSVAQYLAASMLTAFPNTALFEPTIEDRHDSTPVLLRRAVTFIDDNAHRSISLTEIAEAVFVSPRALQYMFRKHFDCTPMQYVRRVRLDHAHRDLLAGTRSETTVSAVAAKWGFGHLSRFAVDYRSSYGVSPHVTLQD